MDVLVALINGMPDWFRLEFLMDTSLLGTLQALGYIVFEDGSIIP